MSRFSTIFYSVLVPSIVALALMKLGERHNINLLDLKSLTETIKNIFTNVKDSTIFGETQPKPSETVQKTKEKLVINEDEKNSSPQKDTKKEKPLKADLSQNNPANKAEANAKSVVKESEPVKKLVEVKQKSNAINLEQSGAKPVSNLSNEGKKASEKSTPTVSKTVDKSALPQQNKVTSKPAEEKKKPEPEYVYTNPQSKAAADVLKMFIAEFDKSLTNHLIGLKSNNEIMTAIKVVTALKESLPKGSKCSLTEEEEGMLTKINKEVETMAKNCVNRQLSNDNDLKLAIRESLKKVRDVDVNLRQNLEQCPQPPSNFCIQTKTKLLKALSDLSSEESKRKLTALSTESVRKAKSNVDLCVKTEYVEIKLSLEKIHSKLNSCGKP